MESLEQLYKIGYGPSSSHTMGPQKAAQEALEKFPNAKYFEVELRGSLAATGKGHLTDRIIIKTLAPLQTDIIRKPRYVHPFHTNGMKFIAYDEKHLLIDEWVVFSVGGGSIKTLTEIQENSKANEEIYPQKTLAEITAWCEENQKELREYVEHYEGESIREYLKLIADTMFSSIDKGLNKEGTLPGPLKLERKASTMYKKTLSQPTNISFNNKIFAYALAVAEENSGGGIIVTAPTCGSAGVLPGLLKAMVEEYRLTSDQILKGLAIGGIIGNLIKHNATISGAEGGCQAEIGSACAMASAMAVYFMGGNIDQIQYAAETGIEHHLGMTCDPIGGFVQIPCIERNAIVSTRALNTAIYCTSTNSTHTISFDQVVETMKETGKDLRSAYRETSLAGLARHYEDILLKNGENDSFTKYEESK